MRVNDDPIGNGKSQFLPRIALDQTTGNIAVSFYDCRNSSTNGAAEVWASVSTDGGVTFSSNVKVSKGVSCALVYVDPQMDAAEVRRHLNDFGYKGIPAILDGKHKVVGAAGAFRTGMPSPYGQLG